ncbi:MAG: PAS domain S-box protein [Bacteroidales bacterium]|nr:PAS domain S-box protein [Bacteroidales bacterium]
MVFNLYAIPVYAAFIAMLLFLIFSIKNRKSKHMYYFVLFNLASATYILFYCLEISTTNFELMKVFYRLEYLGIPFVPIFFLLFVLKFTGYRKGFKSKLFPLVYLIPIFITISVFTNSAHNLFIKQFELNESGFFPTLILNKGVFYWINQIYTSLSLIIGIIALIVASSRSDSKKQFYVLILSCSFPFLLFIIYLMGFIPYNLDPIPFSFLFSSLLIYFGLSGSNVLQSSDILSEALFENIDSSVVIIDNNNLIADINEKAIDKLGLSDADIGSQADIVLPFWFQYKLSKNSKSFIFKDNLRNKTYNINGVELNNLINGKIGLVFIISDVTDSLNIEQALQEKDESYKDIVDNATDLIQSVDTEGNIIFVNNAWIKTLGYQYNDLKNIKIWDIIDGDSLIHCQQIFSNIKDGNCENNIRTVFKTKSGKKVHVEGNINCKTQNDILVGTRGIFRDITEKIKHEDTLSKQLKNQKLISEITSDFIDADYNNIEKLLVKAVEKCGKAYETDRVIIYLINNNEGLLKSKYLYIKKSEFELYPDVEAFRQESFPWWRKEIAKKHYVYIPDVIKLPKEAQNEKTSYLNQGIKTLLSLSLNSKSKVLGFIGLDNFEDYRVWSDEEIHTLQIITEIISKTIVKIKVEESLRKTKEQFQLAVNGSNDGIWDWDLSNNSLFLSDKWKTMLGYEPHEIENKIESFFSIIHADDIPKVQTYLDDYLVGKVQYYSIDFRAKHKSGHYLWIRAKGEGIRGENGKIVRMAGSHTDITREVNEKDMLLEMIQNSEILIKGSGDNFYDKITENIRKVSGAEYCAFNIYKNDQMDVRTISIAGINERIVHACSSLGIDLVDKEWTKNQELENILVNQKVYSTENLTDFTSLKTFKKPLERLIKSFNIGNTVIVRISNNQKLLGYFTLIFKKNTELRNLNLLDLYTYYIALYMERKSFIQDLRNSEIKYRELIENAGLAIAIFKNAKIVYINNMAENLFGYSFNEISTLSVTRLVEYKNQDQMKKALLSLKANENPRNFDTAGIVCKNGKVKQVEFSTVKIVWENSDAVLVFAKDVSEDLESKQRLKLKEKLLLAVARSTDELLKTTEVLDASKTVVRLLGEATNVDRVYIFQNNFDDAGNPLKTSSQRIEWNSGVSEPQIDNPELMNIPFELIHDFITPLENNRPFMSIVSEMQDTETKRILESQDILSVLVMPLFVENKFWGFVGFDDCKEHKVWSNDEFSIIQSFAGTLAAAIERKALISKLQQSVKDAQKANAAKSEFLANMSHEIRTPLNGVIGFTELLINTKLNENQNKFAKTINNSANALLALINDILDFSKIEAGKLELNKEWVNLKDLISNIFDIVKLPADEKQLKLICNYKNDAPIMVFSDELRMRQIFLNLLSNAIKFTENGFVEIDIEVIKIITKSKNTFKITIKDSGIGIPIELQANILDSFTQADASITKKYGGSGLGLTIVNRILNTMESKLEFVSIKDKGSEFYFNLDLEVKDNDFVVKTPINEIEAQLGKNANDKEYVANAETLKVLIVEDNETNMLLTKHIIQTLIKNAIIIEATGGQEGIDMFQESNPDLIFLDIHMPQISGYQVAEEIRKMENGKVVPIIAISAGTLSDEKEKCIKAGMNDFITKPASISIIQKVVEKYLGKI